MYTIGIIGAGQLGSRHLQSLANIKFPLAVYVADVNAESLSIANSRFNEVNTRPDHKVVYTDSSDNFPQNMDVVIIATNSMVRRTVIDRLLNSHTVRHLILEKFLFPEMSDYDFAEKKFAQYPFMKVWVNCARRAYEFYKDIIVSVQNQGPVNFSIIGSGWGLGCNSIHYVDLFACLINDCNIYVLDQSIDDEYIASKRQGYIEFTGSLYLGGDDGHRMEITSYKTGSHPAIVRISTPISCWTINETGRTLQYASVGNKWIPKVEDVVLPLQSQIGAVIVTDLLTKDSCDLPSYIISQKLHQCLLTIFLNKFNSINRERKELCPIT